MTPIDEARSVAATFLRERGDETGARVLERADESVARLHVAMKQCEWFATYLPSEQGLFDLLAYLDPAWVPTEAERAHDEALAMHAEWQRERDDHERTRAYWNAYPGHGAG